MFVSYNMMSYVDTDAYFVNLFVHICLNFNTKSLTVSISID